MTHKVGYYYLTGLLCYLKKMFKIKKKIYLKQNNLTRTTIFTCNEVHEDNYNRVNYNYYYYSNIIILLYTACIVQNKMHII